MIGAVVLRLREACPWLRSVQGVAALAMLKPGSDRASAPAAYVHPVSDRGGPNRLLTAVDQRLDRRFGVMLSLTVTDQTRGEAPAQDLDVMLPELRAALVGWQPTGSSDFVLFDSGALRLAENGVLWWLDVFSTAQNLRRV